MGNLKMGTPSKKEVDDEDVRSMNDDDINPDLDDEESEPDEERDEDLDDDLEGDPEPDSQVSEPSEVDRLKELGVYKPGLVETFADLAKSWRHSQRMIHSGQHKETQAPSNEDILAPVLAGLDNPDPSVRATAVFRLATAAASGSDERSARLEKRLLKMSDPEGYGLVEDDLEQIMSDYPSLTLDDAFDMAVGRNKDTYASIHKEKAIKIERSREATKQLASRERSGGIRTATASLESRLNGLANKYEGDELRQRMAQLIESEAK